MRDVVQHHGVPGVPMHGKRMNAAVMGIKRPLAGAVESQGTQPEDSTDSTMRHHHHTLCLCYSQNLVDRLHGTVVKTPPRFSPRWSNVIWVRTAGSIDVRITLANLRRGQSLPHTEIDLTQPRLLHHT